MKKIIKLMMILMLGIGLIQNILVLEVNADPQIAITKVNTIEDANVYLYDASQLNTIESRLPYIVPIYFIYGDSTYDETSTMALLTSLGIVEHLDDYTAKAYIINPSNGSTYDETNDLAVFKKLLTQIGGVTNVKVIGIGDGATFVNNVISQNCWAIAGIMTYGGSMISDLTYNVAVPTYIHNGTTVAINYYKSANQVDQQTNVISGVNYYNSNNTLQRVVVSNLNDSEEPLAKAFENAWNTVFSKNYRYYNYTTEFYTANPLNYTDPWELVVYPMFDELGIEVNAVTANIIGNNPNLWHEYIPIDAKTAENGTIPLMILLHGNGNDNRTQPETSGWIEVAAKENFICVAAEWQGTATYSGLGEEGLLDLINLILTKYPQIDASRIYMTGLSAGSMNSTRYGFKNASIFAAVGGFAGPFGLSSDVALAESLQKDGVYLPFYYTAGTTDVYKPIPVRDISSAGNSLFYSIQAMQIINGLEKSETVDLTANKYFGLALENQEEVTIGTQKALVGTLSNDYGTIMKLVGIENYAHWNYKPVAEDMWEFFKHYSRELDTGKLLIDGTRIYTNEEIQTRFLTELSTNDYAEIGGYSVERMQEGVYHIHDATIENYAGEHPDGRFVNPSSMYLFVDTNKALLFDAGNENVALVDDLKIILDALVKDKTLEIALTHKHGDHIGQLLTSLFNNDIKIYCPEKDYTAISNKLSRYTNIELINDGDLISLDNFEFYVQYLTGHTEGSVVFIDHDNQIVILGDAIGSGFVWLFSDQHALELYEEGLVSFIDTIKELENPIFLAGHRWQQTWQNGPAPGEITKTYVNSMLSILKAIKEDNATINPYTARGNDKDIEITIAGHKAAIQTTEDILANYLESNKIEQNPNDSTPDNNKTPVTGDTNNSSLYLFLILICSSATGGIYYYKKRYH